MCQLKVTAYKENNIYHARTAVEEAAEKGAKLVLLPVRSYYSSTDWFVSERARVLINL